MYEKDNKKKWHTLFATSSVLIMCMLDSSITSIAIPNISIDLNISLEVGEIVSSIYLFVICLTVVPLGKLSNYIGKIRLFQTGTVIFILASLMCALSNDILFLIISRAIQAIGASMVMSTNYAIIKEEFKDKEAGIALGINSAVVQVGIVLGPPLGGFLLSTFKWNYIFLINLPIGILACLYGKFAYTHHEKTNLNEKLCFDWLGTLLFSGSISILYVAISFGDTLKNVFFVFVLLLTFLTFFTLFIFKELNSLDPLIDVRIFKSNIGLVVGIATTVLVYSLSFFMNVIFPVYLQNILLFPANLSGLLLMLIPLSNSLSSVIGGALSDKTSSRSVSLVALFIFIITEGLLIRLTNTTSIYYLVLPFLLFGTANGLYQNNLLVMESVNREHSGVAGSLIALGRNLGMLIGVAIATKGLFWYTGEGQPQTSFSSYTKGITRGMILDVYIMFFLTIISLVLVFMVVWSRYRKKIHNKV